MKPEDFTIEFLEKNYADIYQAEEYRRSIIYPATPKSPLKPSKPLNQSAKDYREYADQLEVHEKALRKWKKIVNDKRKIWSEVNAVMHEFAKKVSALDSIPKKYQQKCWDLAWSEHHSSGYCDVVGFLNEIASIFEDE